MYCTDLGQNLFFFALFKPIILQFFTFLPDKLHPFNIQDDQSMHYKMFSWTEFHNIRTVQSEQPPMLLCSMQGNNGILAKIKKKAYFHFISKITHTASQFRLFDKCQICSASCCVFKWTVTELHFNIMLFFVFTMCNLYNNIHEKISRLWLAKRNAVFR